ncbi:DUF732 domain-containing protein [Streptomyces sp. NPDC048665]|uniref:DUF732 domain-containing protein n=1 Tax=Streptomyces sp. NPDC048665 TaxID=3155490 RepID=UPI003414D5C4
MKDIMTIGTAKVITMAAAAAVMLLLSACRTGKGDTSLPSSAYHGKDPTMGKPSTTASAPPFAPTPARAVLPPEPTGEVRERYISAMLGARPAFLGTTPEQVIQWGREHCASLGGQDEIAAAKRRFASPHNPVTTDQARMINAAVRAYICPQDKYRWHQS